MAKMAKTSKRSRTATARDNGVMSIKSLLNPATSTSKRATIRYLRRESFLVTGSPYVRMTNFEPFPDGRTPAQPDDVPNLHIQDVRELHVGEQPQLRTHGFSIQLFAPIFPRKPFEEDMVTPEVINECCARVNRLVWAKVALLESKVVDWELRYGPPGYGRMGPEDIPGVELPMHQPYADKFGLVGFDELAQNWPEKFGQRKAGDHWGILKCVNDKFWVPLVHKGDERVTNWPLAICNPNTVARRRDFERGEIQLGGQIDTTHMAYYNPNHKWHFLSMQSGCQVWYWVLWDSNSELPQNVMVSTFDTGVGDQKRMSLEFKIYVKYKE